MDANDTVILLTACVNTNGAVATKLQDADVRISQYKEALRFYLENTPYRILFVENSSCDFSHDFTEYIGNGRLEYLAYPGNNYGRSLGKGYGEAQIIAYAMAHSKFAAGSSVIIKITGRIIVENIGELCGCWDKANTKGDPSIACNIRPSKKIGTSTFFICRKPFLSDYFLPRMEEINEAKHVWFEHALYDAIISCGSDKCAIFSKPIKIKGVAGSTSKPYPKATWLDHVFSFCAAFLHNKFNFMKF